MPSTFFAADFRNMEGRLTAHFSKDPVSQAELDAELIGGPKQHALNGAMLYGCTPQDAKSFEIILKGAKSTAYDGGKRCTHMCNYGGGASMLASTFWLPRDVAETYYSLIYNKYIVTSHWREGLADQVFGLASYECLRCNAHYTQHGPCGACSKGKTTPVMPKWLGYDIAPERRMWTAFGRLRHYPGRKASGANAVASQPGQSCGASIWNRVLLRTLDPNIPGPPNRLLWNPSRPLHDLYAAVLIAIVTGTYDSYLGGNCGSEPPERVLEWLLWHMEQPWPQLGGLRLPAEGSLGHNWGKFDPKHPEDNPHGLQEIPRIPFTATNPYA